MESVAEGRRPWPRGHEVNYWRAVLVRHVVQSPKFRRLYVDLRAAWERDEVRIHAEVERLVQGDDLWIGFEEQIIRLFSDPLEVYEYRFGHATSAVELRRLSDSSEYEYPDLLFEAVRELKLTYLDAPARWATHQIDRVIRSGAIVNPELAIFSDFRVLVNWDRSISIHVNAEGAHVETGDGVARLPASSDFRFGSESDWDALRKMAVESAVAAVDQIASEFHDRYVSPSTPQRNPSRDEKWLILAERIALQLTGRLVPGQVSRDQRRHFCQLIELDNPGAQKLRR